MARVRWALAARRRLATRRRSSGEAKLQLQAIELGGTVTYFEPEEARLVEARREYERQWELWTRKANGGK